MTLFDELIHGAEQQVFAGWDFSFLAGRMQEGQVNWDYRQAVVDAMASAQSMLDMGTGGGEFLASLVPLPADTCATEAWQPNIPVARSRLAPLGVSVIPIDTDRVLPFADCRFDLIINRHEAYHAAEIRRIANPQGMFITQQVGAQNERELNQAMEAPVNEAYKHWTLDYAIDELEQAGWTVLDAFEEFPEIRFSDIGAVVFYLKVIEWQIPGFSVERYRRQLQQLHERIQVDGGLSVHAHRFFIRTQAR